MFHKPLAAMAALKGRNLATFGLTKLSSQAREHHESSLASKIHLVPMPVSSIIKAPSPLTKRIQNAELKLAVITASCIFPQALSFAFNVVGVFDFPLEEYAESASSIQSREAFTSLVCANALLIRSMPWQMHELLKLPA